MLNELFWEQFRPLNQDNNIIESLKQNFVCKHVEFMIDLITTYIKTAHLAIKDGKKIQNGHKHISLFAGVIDTQK